jgi:N-acetylglucosaminyl-diphospho-decaprenol L-rhamnosyltransferase
VKPDISILIVTFQCRDAARECLASIYRLTTGTWAEVIVVDNASSDGTAAMVATEFPQAKLVVLDENVGFARGVNLAAEQAEGEYLLLLNPDTVVHERAIDALLDFARSHPEHGVYGGRALWPDGSTQPGSCWGRPTPWSLICFGTLLTTAFPRSRLFNPEMLGTWQRDSVREVDIVTGCLLLIPRRLWDELGGFDDVFFMYGEDADLSLRARKHGFRPAITPDAVVTHVVGVSSESRSDKMVLVFQSKVTLLRKHWPPWLGRFGIAMLWLGVGLRALLTRLAGRGSDGADTWVGVWRARRSWLAGYTRRATAETAS